VQKRSKEGTTFGEGEAEAMARKSGTEKSVILGEKARRAHRWTRGVMEKEKGT